MPAAVHSNVQRAPMTTDNTGRSRAPEDMEWHGLYQDLLFQRGPANPPCSHPNGGYSEQSFLAEKQTLEPQEPAAAFGNVATSDQDDYVSTPAAVIQDFLSDSAKVSG